MRLAFSVFGIEVLAIDFFGLELTQGQEEPESTDHLPYGFAPSQE